MPVVSFPNPGNLIDGTCLRPMENWNSFQSDTSVAKPASCNLNPSRLLCESFKQSRYQHWRFGLAVGRLPTLPLFDTAWEGTPQPPYHQAKMQIIVKQQSPYPPTHPPTHPPTPPNKTKQPATHAHLSPLPAAAKKNPTPPAAGARARAPPPRARRRAPPGGSAAPGGEPPGAAGPRRGPRPRWRS